MAKLLLPGLSADIPGFSPVTYCNKLGTITDGTFDQNIGVGFALMAAGHVTGVKFEAYAGFSGTVTVRLWDPGGTSVASASGSVSAGINTISFATPYYIDQDSAYKEYVVSVYTASSVRYRPIAS